MPLVLFSLFPQPLPNPRPSISTLPFCCPEGEDMSQHSDLKVRAASESSECNHFRKSRTHNYRESHPPYLLLLCGQTFTPIL